MSEKTSKEDKIKQLNEKLNAMMQKKGLSLATSLLTKPVKEVSNVQSKIQQKQEQNHNEKSKEQKLPKKTKKIQKQQTNQKLHKQQKNKNLRKAAGLVWEDKTMQEWPENDYRLFVGSLGKEATDELLSMVFRNRYPSFNMARVVVDRRTGLNRGYGFVSFSQPRDFLNALKQMNGQYVGNRPIKVEKSNWKDRNIDSAKNQFLPSDFKTNSKKETHHVHMNFKYQYPI